MQPLGPEAYPLAARQFDCQFSRFDSPGLPLIILKPEEYEWGDVEGVGGL